MSEFFAMGGYGGFVWPAFGMTAGVMIWLLTASLRQLRANQRLLDRLQTANPRRNRQSHGADTKETAQ